MDSICPSSSLRTSPAYPNLVTDNHVKARHPRRELGGIVDCYHILTKTFGHKEYKGKQREVVEAAVRGADVFVLAPTGMGKSLCFQIPAVADKQGITIVVSPLLALMKNQVARLRQISVPVVAFTSETSAAEKLEIIGDLSSGHPMNRLLYITPEKFCTADFMKLLTTVYENGELNRLVVDEAHCISEWGHDFRSEYRRLGNFRQRFIDVPIMALTATATAAVQNDIVVSLRMSEDHLFKVVHPFNRANLFYEVRYMSIPNPVAQMASIHEYITTLYRRRKRPSSGIIYCRTRKTCDELSAYLRGKGLSSRPYHRGITPATLDKTLTEWEMGGTGDGGVDVVCATIAFGMGIDKADVRYIIHYDLPKSFEGYYQETGRAGRDGSPSKCILYYSREDLIRVKALIKFSHTRRVGEVDNEDGFRPSQRAADSLTALANFSESSSICRHVSICRYFGEPIDTDDSEIMKRYCDGMCDVCKYPDKTKRGKLRLSTEAGNQVAEQHMNNKDEARNILGKPSRQANSVNTAWKTNFREGDNDDNSVFRAGVAQGRTMSNRGAPFPNHHNLGTAKRFNTEAGSNGSSKRARSNYTASMLLSSSKQFQSASTLMKPFKTPFKMPPIKQLAAAEEQEPDKEEIIEVEDIGNERNDIEEQTDVRPSSPLDFPDMDVELEVSFSQKIDRSLRQNGFNTIRRALHKLFGGNQHETWGRLKSAPINEDSRNEFLAIVAQQLEFGCHSMSTTADGYTVRMMSTVDAVKLLAQSDAWDAAGGDEWDDSRDIVDIMRRVCDSRSTGKGRVTGQ